MSVPLPIAFQPAPAHPQLGPGEVHLWRADLDEAGARDSARFAALLSPEEQARAERFHFEQDAARFVAARGLLRLILARYTRTQAAELHLGTGPFGKPELLWPEGGWRFNLSHSGSLWLLAITQGREVGVDLELMRGDVPFSALAEHFLEPAAARQISGAPMAQRTAHFYEAWTSTEARLKAAGTGFAEPESQPDRWSLRTLTPAYGYSAALAVEGGAFELQCWTWLN